MRRRSDKVLILGDLHIGWESSLKEQGMHIPSQTPRLLEKIKKLIDLVCPTRIILVGDVKHTVAKVGFAEWHDVPSFFENLLEHVHEISVIPGNHDGNLRTLMPKAVGILPASGLTIANDVGIIHGHAWPEPKVLGCSTIVMGHLHPIISLTDSLGILSTHQVWLRSESAGEILAQGLLKHLRVRKTGDTRGIMKESFDVNLTNPRCIFLPSFNDLLGGQIINRSLKRSPSKRQYLGPLLRSGGIRMDDGDVYLLDGSYLGKLGFLQSLS
ncbi:metallophosphoesterase [Candidatus Bathyarchaeota archaeon]|nr:metallophosphoesterase [Candidatus Bathyarchaeota archaeon]